MITRAHLETAGVDPAVLDAIEKLPGIGRHPDGSVNWNNLIQFLIKAAPYVIAILQAFGVNVPPLPPLPPLTPPAPAPAP